MSGMKGRLMTAASQGNLEMVKYCVANECPIDERACAWAARCGHLEVLKYLREEVKAPWDSDTASWAASNGHLHILEYLVERKYDQFKMYACFLAAEYGHLDCLKYLHETAKAPWDYDAIRSAHENNHPDCVQYLLDNDCPLPFGWSIRRWRVTRTRIRIGIRILIRILIRITLVLEYAISAFFAYHVTKPLTSLILSRLPSRDKTCSQKHTTDSSLLFTRRRRLRLGALVFKAATKADSCHSLRVVYVSERRETLHVSALGGNQSRRRRRRMKRRQKRSERTTTTKKKAPCFKVSTNLPSTGVITNAKAT